MYKKSEDNQGIFTAKEFPVNAHGEMLSFGAPWETPAMYNTIEAVQQLAQRHCRRETGAELQTGPGVWQWGHIFRRRPWRPSGDEAATIK
jgi:hypothetical protein